MNIWILIICTLASGQSFSGGCASAPQMIKKGCIAAMQEINARGEMKAFCLHPTSGEIVWE